MKTRLFGLFLIAMLTIPAMTGCQAGAAGRKLESAGRTVEYGMESAGDTQKRSAGTTSVAASNGNTSVADANLTMEEAQSIALKHAGLTADQVTALHTEYEIEHDIAKYDVEFRHGNWEYDYEINANTGEIFSFSKDD